MTDANRDATVAAFAAEMLRGGTHPIVAFVALYAMQLAGDVQAVEVHGTHGSISSLVHAPNAYLFRQMFGSVIRDAKDFLLIEITPAQEDFGKLLGSGGEIIDQIRTMAQRMAKAQGIHVEIKIREVRPQKHGNRR